MSSEIQSPINRGIILFGLIAIGLYAGWQGDDYTLGVITGGLLGLLKGAD